VKKTEFLSQKKERLTSQKKIILDYLRNVKTHPSAERIFLSVRKKLPRISKGTVYRILHNFNEKRDARLIPVKGVAHFDGDMASHAHFICCKCDRIFDIFDMCSNCKVLKNKKTKFGKINYYKIYFYGICESCRK